MKYIAFSFDDGRADTYEVAKPILEKYSMKATVNIISDYVINPEHYSFESSNRGMSHQQVQNWLRWGGEIASHSSTHRNSAEDIVLSLAEIEQLGIDVSNIGFASPGSWLTEENAKSSGIEKLLGEGKVTYLRSGIQIRREGLIYTALSVLEQFTHSRRLYYVLNRRCVIKMAQRIYLSAAIKDYTKVRQIQYLIDKVEDGQALIIMFHGILPSDNSCYGKDHYYWDASYFEELCSWIAGKPDFSVVTVKELIEYVEGKMT